MANMERGIENGNRTQFGLGSISKSFTSLMVVKVLHEAFPDLGEAVLDTPIRRLLPNFNLTLIDRFRSEHSTFRDLLAHQTCVFDMPIMGEPFDTMEEYMYRARYNPEVCEFRTFLSYNNQLYAMAGELAGIVAGKSFEAAMQDMWDGLGMNDTAIIHSSDNFTEMPYYKDREADEVRLMNPELVKRIRLASAAGGIFSTAEDMAIFMRAIMNLGNIDGKQVIPADAVRWMTKPTYAMPDLHFKRNDRDMTSNMYGYGLGLLLAEHDGWEYNFHPGSLLPYDNYMSMWPGKKLAVYTGTHQEPKRAGEQALHLLIFEWLHGDRENAKEKATNYLQKIKISKDKEAKEAAVGCQQHLDRILRKGPITVGNYGSGPSGDLELSERFNEDKNLTQYFIEYGKWYHGWLELVEGETALYKIIWVTDVVQEDGGLDNSEGRHCATIPGDDTITIEGSYGVVGVFKLGESLETLPVIPWDPENCFK